MSFLNNRTNRTRLSRDVEITPKLKLYKYGIIYTISLFLETMMPTPTLEEATLFMQKNEYFFRSFLILDPNNLIPKEQDGLKKIYTTAGVIKDLESYSEHLKDLLYKYRATIKLSVKQPVIVPWRKGNFAPALAFPEIREFLVENQNNPALLFAQQLQYQHQYQLQKQELVMMQQIPGALEASPIVPQNLIASAASTTFFSPDPKEQQATPSSSSHQTQPKKLANMDVNELFEWISNQGTHVAKSAHLFTKNLIDGGFFVTLTDEDLKEIGISSALTRRMLLSFRKNTIDKEDNSLQSEAPRPSPKS